LFAWFLCVSETLLVVLGGDTPLGFPLIQDLERKGYIVVASVSTAAAVDALERKCHGYVRALVLDPSAVGGDSRSWLTDS
jgi:hypothetical protein